MNHERRVLAVLALVAIVVLLPPEPALAPAGILAALVAASVLRWHEAAVVGALLATLGDLATTGGVDALTAARATVGAIVAGALARALCLMRDARRMRAEHLAALGGDHEAGIAQRVTTARAEVAEDLAGGDLPLPGLLSALVDELDDATMCDAKRRVLADPEARKDAGACLARSLLRMGALIRLAIDRAESEDDVPVAEPKVADLRNR